MEITSSPVQPLSAAASPAMSAQANYANVLAAKAIQQITEPVPAVLPNQPAPAQTAAPGGGVVVGSGVMSPAVGGEPGD